MSLAPTGGSVASAGYACDRGGMMLFFPITIPIMRLKGSCSCGAVKFSLDSHTPYPYMRCYCSICRKTQGGGGYAVNIMGVTKSFKIDGEQNVHVYRARIAEGRRQPKKLSEARRHFCAKCGSALWIWDPRWADWVYPFASAIDTPLPKPIEEVAIMLDYAAPWVEIPEGPDDAHFAEFPEEGIADWHRKRLLDVP
jgi:hypothetical protein